MTTVYLEAKQLDKHKEKPLLYQVATIVAGMYRAKYGKSPDKVKQKEGQFTFWVFSYPDDFIPVIKHEINQWKPKPKPENIPPPPTLPRLKVEKKAKRPRIKKKVA